MKIQFNTGRQYSANGQRIVAEFTYADRYGNPGILFNDLDRHIDGFIPWEGLMDCRVTLKEVVMFNYDHGNYKWHSEAKNLEWGES